MPAKSFKPFAMIHPDLHIKLLRVSVIRQYLRRMLMMSRPRKGCCRLAILGACGVLVSVVLLTNLLWASTSTNIFSSWNTATASAKEQEEPEEQPLVWEEVAEAPVRRLDGAAVQIGSLLYVFAGYSTINEVHSHVDVYNVKNNKWEEQIKMPDHMAHSHLGMATDGRYIYVVTGQVGPQCRGATAASFVLDSQTRAWAQIPPLPVPRYAPATQIWKGRLHVMGGSKENRRDPALDHWSLAVQNGIALELEWRREVPIPRGGPHRASAVVQNRLYLLGGQEGDFVAKPGSPIFKCSRQPEVVYADVYMLESTTSNWISLPSMPKPNSHIEFASMVVGRFVFTAGGSTEKNPVTKKMVLIGDVFLFDTESLTWRTIGQLPYRVKTALVAYWDGCLYVSSGQRDKGGNDSSPKKIVGQTWRTNLTLSLGAIPQF